jgi:hypothetical protein
MWTTGKNTEGVIVLSFRFPYFTRGVFRDVFGWMIRGDNAEIAYIHDLSICGK